MSKFFTIRPDLGASTPEPSLEDILFQYYKGHDFTTEQAQTLSVKYLNALPQHNGYDSQDRIDRVAALVAGPMKLAAYKVRDPETNEWGPIQFHMTYDNTVMAVMGTEAAKLFATFVGQTLTS